MESVRQEKAGFGAGIGAIGGLLFTNFNGPPLELGDYILVFCMMFFTFFTFFYTLKPACSYTMRGGDRQPFIALSVSAFFYFVYYLFAFVVYTIGPHENQAFVYTTGYACLEALAVFFSKLALGILLYALLIANKRDLLRDVLDDDPQYHNHIPPNPTAALVAICCFLIIAVVDFVLILDEALPSSILDWSATTTQSFNNGSQAMSFMWEIGRLGLVGWLWYCSWARKAILSPGSRYHRVVLYFICPLLFMASVGLLAIDAQELSLSRQNKLELIPFTAYELAYRILLTVPEWVTTLTLLAAGRRLALARGDRKGIFQYGHRVRVVYVA